MVSGSAPSIPQYSVNSRYPTSYNVLQFCGQYSLGAKCGQIKEKKCSNLFVEIFQIYFRM